MKKKLTAEQIKRKKEKETEVTDTDLKKTSKDLDRELDKFFKASR